MDWMKRMVVLDVETTGLSPTQDRITELGFALFENGRWTQFGDRFVNPEGRAVSAEITELTGVRFEDVMDAPPFWQAWNEIAPYVYNATPVAWNAPFDRAFIFNAIARSWPRHAFGELPWCLRPDVRWIDVQLLARAHFVERGGRNFKLGQIAQHVGMHAPEAHRADADAHTAGSLLLYMLNDELNGQGSRNGPTQWTWPAVMERQQVAGYAYAAKQWFWRRKKNAKRVEDGEMERDELEPFLPHGQRVQVYECDVCHRMEAGVLKHGEKGGLVWTKPPYWLYYGGPGVADQCACSPACELVASWHVRLR